MKKRIVANKNNNQPSLSFYHLSATANNGSKIQFQDFTGKKVLIVNTASDCGYTAQFYELEKLHGIYKNTLVIIAFPANDFKKQEPGSDTEIGNLCRTTFGVKFLLMKKSKVVKAAGQNEVYQWLTDKNKNGWNETGPEWNFSKYLVNENGSLTHYFGPSVSPLDEEIKKNLE